MAERFGGRYSLGGGKAGGGERPRSGVPAASRAPARRPERMRLRLNLLFLAPLPLLLTAFAGGALTLATDLGALALLLGAAWLTGEGVRAADAYEARTVARRPTLPRKLLGSALTAAGVGLAAFGGDAGVLAPVIYGAVAAALHLGAFGIDPLRNKVAEGADDFQSGRVAKAVDEAERHLAAMREAIGRAGDRRLEARVMRFQGSARALFRKVEEDPRDLPAARRYLSVYLQGARDATARFADLYARTRDEQARADYEALLDDLESNFEARTETLLLESRESLDVEIEVLRDRLKREGVSTD